MNFAGRVYGEEEMVNLVDSALDFWLTSSAYGDRFESKMRVLFGSRDFVLTNSASSANLAAVSSLLSSMVENALRLGDEVITPAVTFPSTVSPLLQAGLVPVFVDCEVWYLQSKPSVDRASSLTQNARYRPTTHTGLSQ